MRIHVTQGHEKGVGLEIFIKSFICLSKQHQTLFTLHCNYSTLQNCLELCNIKGQIRDNELYINSSTLSLTNIDTVKPDSLSQTMKSLQSAIKIITQKDILLTLPSSKDQITANSKAFSGHTDFLRKSYPEHELTMSFLSPKLNVALLTEHIAIDNVQSSLLDLDLVKKLSAILKQFNSIRPFSTVFIAGLNPHCGEGGLIGTYEEKTFNSIIDRLKFQHPELNIFGPIPGDTILFNGLSQQYLYIYAFHDQGLAPFKILNGLTGINLTLGLPFKRVSVDHGTAFDLYGKNAASYVGMNYLLREILNWK